jgi:hypothetical protein
MRFKRGYLPVTRKGTSAKLFVNNYIYRFNGSTNFLVTKDDEGSGHSSTFHIARYSNIDGLYLPLQNKVDKQGNMYFFISEVHPLFNFDLMDNPTMWITLHNMTHVRTFFTDFIEKQVELLPDL